MRVRDTDLAGNNNTQGEQSIEHVWTPHPSDSARTCPKRCCLRKAPKAKFTGFERLVSYREHYNGDGAAQSRVEAAGPWVFAPLLRRSILQPNRDADDCVSPPRSRSVRVLDAVSKFSQVDESASGAMRQDQAGILANRSLVVADGRGAFCLGRSVCARRVFAPTSWIGVARSAKPELPHQQSKAHPQHGHVKGEDQPGDRRRRLK